MNNNRTFGVEIELAAIGPAEPQDEVLDILADELDRAAIPAIRDTDGSADEPVGGCWKIVWDCTAGPDGRGGPELISPPMSGHDGLDELRRVCAVLQSLEATVNDHCGLHVHHDAGDLTPSQMVRMSSIYRSHQLAISHFLAPSRRMNHFAMPIFEPMHDSERLYMSVAGESDRARRRRISEALSGGSRHRAVNWMAYGCHGTVEFRQHQGTVDADEIAHWVLFTQAVVSAAVAEIDPRTERPDDRWLYNGPGKRAAFLQSLLWGDVSRFVADDPNYWAMRLHYLSLVQERAAGVRQGPGDTRSVQRPAAVLSEAAA